MRNDNDAHILGRVASRFRRLASLSVTPASWRRPTNRWVAASVLGLIVLAPVADAVSGAPAPTASVASAADVTAGRADAQSAARGTARGATTPKDAKAKHPAKPRLKAKPVAGLSQAQMDNAAMIVNAGQQAGMSKRAYVIAVATSMQESKLLNLANPTVPNSLRHKSQGVGFDHDSVGLFQQRPSSGWGSPGQLLNQEYAAKKFYQGLKEVPGWDQLPLTVAAQSVQGSAFPDAYAQHEGAATQVVDALTK